MKFKEKTSRALQTRSNWKNEIQAKKRISALLE
jgi:hypothetical protein